MILYYSGQSKMQPHAIKKVAQLDTALFGEVLLCEMDGKRVAVKKLCMKNVQRHRTLKGTKVVEDPLMESRILKAVHDSGGHANVVGFKDSYRDRTHMYLVMEYCGGGDLCDFCLKSNALTSSKVVQMFREIVSAVAYVHALGFAHRDVSLENILLTENGVCKLCDFGLAIPLDSWQMGIVGKLSYAAPEALSKTQRHDPAKADIWSLGVILFVLFTGFFPFQTAEKTNQQYRYFLKYGIRSLAQELHVYKKIPSSGFDLIELMLQAAPEKRATMQQIRQHSFTSTENKNLKFPSVLEQLRVRFSKQHKRL